jgi:GNAT superfamily N-acetyltransferase
VRAAPCYDQRVQIVPLLPDHLNAARTLLTRALPYDVVSEVAEEKLFGDNGTRRGIALGAFDGTSLLGLAATAGRWLKVLAVDPEMTRQGVGSALLEAARATTAGRPLRVADHPGNYLSPGLDVRYQAARRFFEHHQFKEIGHVENLRAALTDNPLVTEARAEELCRATEQRGYTVRRAELRDRDELLRFAERVFAPAWAFELDLALRGPRRSVHIALRDQALVAFAAADGNNQGLGWFGPAGTAPEHRGAGLGETLLILCLLDVKDLPDGGVIAWIGPKAFYARACGAGEDRHFVQLEASTP